MDFSKLEPHWVENRLSLLRKHWQLSLELCHFTSELNPLWPTKVLRRKILNIMADLKQLNLADCSDLEKLERLRHFFFHQKAFSITPPEEQTIQNNLLPYILSSRKGPPEILLLLFSTLAEFIELKVQCHVRQGRYLLKVFIDEKPQIVDFRKNAKFLEPYEIVELINEGIDFSKDHNHSRVIVRYLYLLRRLAKRERDLSTLAHTHSYLMKYQPFNLKHVSERAKVAYMTGDFRTAITDIRSYFLYRSPGMNSQSLARIYRMARKKQKDFQT